MNEVYKTLFEATALVVIVVFVFLQSWRTAIIPIVAIPVSLIGTFAVMAALGFSINTLTLFGMVLAIGIVVDDAIVVVENVERNIALGMSPREAAHATMDEVGTAVIAIALVLGGGLRADRLHSRHLGPVLPAVRPDHRRVDAHLGLQLADLVAGAGRAPAQAAQPRAVRATRSSRFGNRLANGFNRGFDATSNGYARAVGSVGAAQAHRAAGLCRASRRHGLDRQRTCRAASFRPSTRAMPSS